MTQADTDTDKKELPSKNRNFFLGCGLFLLTCSLISGILFWGRWPVWFFFGFLGYVFTWAALATQFKKFLRLIFLLFSISNLSLMYFGTILVNSGSAWSGFILIGIIELLIVNTYGLILIQWKWGKPQNKGQVRVFRLWSDPTIGGIGLIFLIFGWNNSGLPRLLTGIIGVFAISVLAKLGTDLKMPFTGFLGGCLFAIGIWMGQTLPDAYGYGWQLFLGYVGMRMFLESIGGRNWMIWLISQHPWYASLLLFPCGIGLMMSLPYIFKAALEQQSLGYSIFRGGTAYILYLYIISYLSMITPKTLWLILDEILPDNKVRDNINFLTKEA